MTSAMLNTDRTSTRQDDDCIRDSRCFFAGGAPSFEVERQTHGWAILYLPVSPWVTRGAGASSTLVDKLEDEAAYENLSDYELKQMLESITPSNDAMLSSAKNAGPPQEWWDDTTDVFAP